MASSCWGQNNLTLRTWGEVLYFIFYHYVR